MTDSVKDRERVLEGTWEEIAPHVPEFEGRRVQVIVYPEAENGSENPQTLDRLLQGRVGNFALEPTDMARNHREYFARIMDGKRREGRL